MTAVDHETERSNTASDRPAPTARRIIAQRGSDDPASGPAVFDLPAAARELPRPDRTGVRARAGVTLAALAMVGATVAIVGSAFAVTTGGDQAPVVDRSSRAVGLATADVLAEDLRVGFGFPFPGVVGLPLTLTNTADVPLSYNVTVEAVTRLGQRITADVVSVGALAPGQSSTATAFESLGVDTRAALSKASFRVVEASSY